MHAESRLNSLLKKEADRSIEICQELVRIPSEDPPGDTKDIAGFILELFKSEGVECEIVSPHPEKPNVVAKVKGGKEGPSVVFNGHMDTFKVGDTGRWCYDPFGGVLENGRIYGRGSSDMKGGLSASLVSIILLNRMRDCLPGEVSITCVSDEEVFGPWGSQYLLENRPDLRGDALINGEPSSLENIRIGEKGQFWFRFTCHAEGGHGAYAGIKASAVVHMMRFLNDLAQLPDSLSQVPENVKSLMIKAREIYDKLLCPGATEAALSASMNVGLISGGLSVNMVPEECTAEVDFRLPPGVNSELLRDWVNRVAQNHVPCSFEEFSSQDALLTDPEEKLVEIALETAEKTLGRKIHATFSLGGTEARLWRQWGVPSITYGPNHHNMGSANEYVMAEELPLVTKVQALTALRFLGTSRG